MPPEEILLVNPNTGTSPVFRSRRDAEITIGIYKRSQSSGATIPRRIRGACRSCRDVQHGERLAVCSGPVSSWNAMAGRLTAMSSSAEGERMLPLYEAKMIHHFDHRLGTYEGQTEAQANVAPCPPDARAA